MAEPKDYRARRLGRVPFVKPTEPFEISITKLEDLASVEKIYILAVLEYMKMNRTHAAKALGISCRGLRNKLIEFGVHHPVEKW